MASTFSYFLSVGALIPTLPRYVEGPLNGSELAVGLTIGAFSLAAVLSRPFIGHLGDRRGRRLLMVAGGLIVGATTILYVVANSLGEMLVLRFVSGLGEAGFYVGAASVINDIAPDERRGEALSYFSLALFGGLALGPLIGESALHISGYNAAWVVAGLTSLLAAALALRVPDTRPEPVERPRERLRILHSAALVPGIVLATNIWGVAGFSAFVPLYALRLGLDGSRLVFALYSGAILVVRFFGARIPDRLGVRRAGSVSLTVCAAGFFVIAWWPEPAGLYVGAVLFALGQSLLFPALMKMAISSAPPQERGAVVGTFTAFFDLAFGLGAVSLGAVTAALGFSGLWVTAAVISLVGLSVLLYYTRARQLAST